MERVSMHEDNTVPNFNEGETLCDRYKLVSRVGAGASGEVWKAIDTLANDRVWALKLLTPRLIDFDGSDSDLIAEAEAGWDLQHKGIVQVHSFHRDRARKGVPFLLMEFVEGRTLARVVRDDGPQQVADVIEWGSHIAEAIDYAHEKGRLHRDIKPGNIMIERDSNRARLLDFGISRKVQNTLDDITESQGQSDKDASGTARYMSPQQLRGNNHSKNDIYSLAATLYHAVAGRAPFTEGDIRWQVENQAPSPISGISNQVNAALIAGLAKQLEPRPESASALIDKLKRTELEPEPECPGIEYFADRIELPFRCVSVITLHDEATAIVAGAEGEIAAINLESGETLASIKAETIIGRPGRGEIRYPSDIYFFLQKGESPGTFYTMSMSGTLKLWCFNGEFELRSTSAIIQRNRASLLETLQSAYGKSDWSSWSCYHQGRPDFATTFDITDAKITPDGRHILCLTDWFVILRCTLDGNLVGSPFVVSDAFAIEAANDDGSQMYIGRSQKSRVGGGSVIVTTSDGQRLGVSSQSHVDACSTSFCRLPGDRLIVGRTILDPYLGSLGQASASTYPRIPVRVSTNGEIALVPSSKRVSVLALDTLQEKGLPLLGGFSENLLDCAILQDGTHALTLEPESLVIWSLDSRRPVGDDDSIIRFATYPGYHRGLLDAGSGYVVINDDRESLEIVDLSRRQIHQVDVPEDLVDSRIFAAFANEENQCVDILAMHYPSEKCPVPEAESRWERVFRWAVGAAKEWDGHGVYLRQYRWIAGAVTFVSEVRLGNTATELGDCIQCAGHPVATMGWGSECIILAGGHLLSYCLSSGEIRRKPTDISRDWADESEWYFRDAMLLDRDSRTIYLRSAMRSVLAVDAYSFTVKSRVRGAASMHASLLMLKTEDERLVVSRRAKNYKDVLSYYKPSEGGEDGKYIMSVELNETSIYSVCRLVGDRYLIGFPKGYVGVLNLDSGLVEHKEQLHEEDVDLIVKVPGSDQFATVAKSGTVRFFSASDVGVDLQMRLEA